MRQDALLTTIDRALDEGRDGRPTHTAKHTIDQHHNGADEYFFSSFVHSDFGAPSATLPCRFAAGAVTGAPSTLTASESDPVASDPAHTVPAHPLRNPNAAADSAWHSW